MSISLSQPTSFFFFLFSPPILLSRRSEREAGQMSWRQPRSTHHSCTSLWAHFIMKKKVNTSIVPQKAKARGTFAPDLTHYILSRALQDTPAGLELAWLFLPFFNHLHYMCYDGWKSCRQAGQSSWLCYKSPASDWEHHWKLLLTNCEERKLDYSTIQHKHQTNTPFIVAVSQVRLGGLLKRPCPPQQAQHFGLTEMNKTCYWWWYGMSSSQTRKLGLPPVLLQFCFPD